MNKVAEYFGTIRVKSIYRQISPHIYTRFLVLNKINNISIKIRRIHNRQIKFYQKGTIAAEEKQSFKTTKSICIN